MKIASFLLSLVFYRTLAVNRHFTVSDGGETKICLKCPPGSYVFKDCIQSEKKSTECGPCPSGRFTDTWNAWHECKACRPYCYGVNEIITTGCQPDQNIVCGCNDGYWHQNAGTASAKCLPLFICGLGFGVDKPATNISDATCIECVDGTNYSSIVSSYETCQPCRDCQKEGFNETKSCTVLSNAECFVPTTSSSTTTESTTKGDDSNDGVEGPSNIKTVIVSIVTILVVIAIIGYCCYKFRHNRQKKKNQNKDSKSFRSNSDEVFEVMIDGRPDEESTRTTRSQLSLDKKGTRNRKISILGLYLGSNIILENDVFPWLSTQLGNDYVRICKLLPGSSGESRISNVDIDNATFKYQGRGGLPDVIAEVLLTWRNKNKDEKNEDELFNYIYSTLLRDKKKDIRDLAVKLRDKFAR